MVKCEKIQRRDAKAQRTQRFLMLSMQMPQVLDAMKILLVFLCVLRASAPLRLCAFALDVVFWQKPQTI